MSTRFAPWIPLLVLALVPLRAAAEARPFVDVYVPYLEEKGESEVALSSRASHGQEGVDGSAWLNRLEFEHAVSDRFSAALYLNFLQDRTLSARPRFDGPSLELIGRLGRPGTRLGNAALYLETRVHGRETEFEPRIIVAHQAGGTLLALNAVGELETTGENEAGESGTEKQVALAGGASRALAGGFRFGLEGRWEQVLADGARDPRALFLGPTVALSAGGLRWAASWQPQLVGSPASGSGLDLGDFPRARYHLQVGVDL